MSSNKDSAVVTYAMWFLLALAAGTALVLAWPLQSGWAHDPAMRYGALCFVLWLVAVVVHYRALPANWSYVRVAYFISGLLCLSLGIVGELQALIYLAFVAIFTIPVGTLWRRLFVSFAAISWMPLWGWLMGPYLGDYTALSSLALALMTCILSLIWAYLLHEATASNPTL
ncbi:MAG: hypothetical protein ACI81V_000019 [Lentimonas sp.]|jgi:hypothetical protein